MFKTLYMLLAISSGGDEFIIDSQLSESDCIAAISSVQTPYDLQIELVSVNVAYLECEPQI